MLSKILKWSVPWQTFLLTGGTFIFFLLFYGMPVRNALIRIYYVGGSAFVNGRNPYEVTLRDGPSNQFKYSPFYALAMAGMSKAKDEYAMVSVWVALGIAAVSFGLSRWIDLSGKVPLAVGLALAACYSELIFSLVITQANALIIGLILIGLAEYRDGRLLSAGSILMLATNLKVYPVIFLASLALKFQPRFLLGAFISGTVLFVLPLCFVGWSHNLAMHLWWIHLVLNDSSGPGILDIATAFERGGFAGMGRFLHQIVVIVSLPLFFGYWFVTKKIDWRPWITFGAATLLLLSPRTEVFTFVLLAPSFVLMAAWCGGRENRWQRCGIIIIPFFAWLVASGPYLSPEPLRSENEWQIVRVLGTFGVWIFTAWILGSDLWKSRDQFVRFLRDSSATT